MARKNNLLVNEFPKPTEAQKREALAILAEQRRIKVQAKIDNSTERAATVLHELLDSEDAPPVVRMASAKDILDRGGFKPIERVAVAMVQPITGMSFQLDESKD